jgi:hypothetical protein
MGIFKPAHSLRQLIANGSLLAQQLNCFLQQLPLSRHGIIDSGGNAFSRSKLGPLLLNVGF